MKTPREGMINISSMRPWDLKNLIRTGEGEFLEFKKTAPDAIKMAREISAFANGGGGTILIGVSDDRTVTGIQGYFEEEYTVQKAASEICTPAVPVQIELVHYSGLDVMVISVPEADQKPVYVKGKKVRHVYVRRGAKSVTASDEMIDLLKNGTSQEGVTFEYGERERALFRFLNEYGEITVEGFARLVNVTTFRSSRILVSLASAGILSLSYRDNVEYFTFSQRLE